MSVFVTVGTTSFDALIEVITSKPVINVSVILEQVFLPPFDFYCKLVKLALVEEILKIFSYCVSLKIIPTLKIRPSVNFNNDFNIRPTLKISPSY